MLTIIENKEAIKKCQKKLEAIWKDFKPIKNVTIGYMGGNHTDSVYYSKELGIWAYSNEEDNRYWNVFGVGMPLSGKSTSIACEINPPFSGIERGIQGGFAQDDTGRFFLIHRGKIGGGRIGIGKKLAVEKLGQSLEQIQDGDMISEVFIIGDLGSSDFSKSLSKFVRKIDIVKKEHTLKKELEQL